MPQVSEDEFKLQVRIPRDLYLKMLEITGHGGEHHHGRVYGGLSKIVILALRDFLSKAPQAQPLNLEDI